VRLDDILIVPCTGGDNGRRLNMNLRDKSVTELVKELRDIKHAQQEVCHELTSRVSSDKGIMAALKEGLIRLNFPAPPGFYRHIHSK
jgi:hypothetical protein